MKWWRSPVHQIYSSCKYHHSNLAKCGLSHRLLGRVQTGCLLLKSGKKENTNSADQLTASLRESSPIWASLTRTLLSSAPRGFAARSHFLARLASLAQIGELACRLTYSLSCLCEPCINKKITTKWLGVSCCCGNCCRLVIGSYSFINSLA